MDLHLDYDAMGKILREDMTKPVHDAAESIAKEARKSTHLHGASIKTKDFTTDRAVTTVLMGHPNAIAIEAKHGLLTKAATSEGFEVKSR